MKYPAGRHIYGVAAIGFGLMSFIWQDFNTWGQIGPLGPGAPKEFLINLFAAVEIVGGLAIQWKRTVRIGSLLLGMVYSLFAMLWIPNIIATPLVYDPWGNFFEQFSLVAGAMICFGSSGRFGASIKLATLGYYCFGVCVISFTLEQLFYLDGTAQFVPGWLPLGQMFWAIATTIALALAAVALLTGRFALSAARLLTLMIVGFGLLIWLPAPFRGPHTLFNWAGNAQNLGIAGAAWMVAEYLSASGAGTASSSQATGS